jgi:two-component system, NarL family, response regulator DegU
MKVGEYMELAIVKEASLYRGAIVDVLQQTFKNSNVKSYSSREYKDLLQMDCLADLLIVDLDTEIDVFSLVNFYQSQEKKVIIWTSNLLDDKLINLFKLDLDGYFFNGMEREELIAAIRKVLDVGRYIHSELAPILLGDYVRLQKKDVRRPVGILSRREWEVLELLTKGYKNDDIGKFLFIAEKTVKNHVSSILDKLKVIDRTNAVILAFRNRWFEV